MYIELHITFKIPPEGFWAGTKVHKDSVTLLVVKIEKKK